MSNQTAVTILYPVAAAGPDVKPFNLEYYINTHMAMVQAQWPAHGLLSWQVVKLDEASGWVAMCLSYWKDAEGFKNAVSVSEEIMADSPNYSSVKPVVIAGKVVGASP